MSNQTLFSTPVILADTDYTAIVASETGIDKLVTAVFMKNNNGTTKVIALAVVPDGDTAGETHEIHQFATLADDATQTLAQDIVLPAGYSLYAVGDADITVIAQGKKASAGNLDIV